MFYSTLTSSNIFIFLSNSWEAWIVFKYTGSRERDVGGLLIPPYFSLTRHAENWMPGVYTFGLLRTVARFSGFLLGWVVRELLGGLQIDSRSLKKKEREMNQSHRIAQVWKDLHTTWTHPKSCPQVPHPNGFYEYNEKFQTPKKVKIKTATVVKHYMLYQDCLIIMWKETAIVSLLYSNFYCARTLQTKQVTGLLYLAMLSTNMS